VNERWVCKRCFADNDDTASACHRCGLTRGAEASETDAAAWSAASEPDAPKRSGGWQRLLRFWWIAVIVIPLAVGFFANARRDDGGAIADGGTLSVEDLRVGDCFVFVGDDEQAEEISEVDARPCGEPHEYEIYHVSTVNQEGSYPTEDQWTAHIIDACDPSFESYVGRSYDESVLEVIPFTPTEAGWNDGDRVIQCAVLDPEQGELTTSLRDANR
jgi:hypothetical protein